MREPWGRDEKPAFVNTYELPWESGHEPSFIAGLQQRALSRDAQSGASTSMIAAPAECEVTILPSDATTEIFVLDGEMQLDEEPLRVGGYAYLPQGGSAVNLSSAHGVRFFLFWTPDMDVASSPKRRITSVWQEPWQQGILDNKQLALRWKSLRIPDANEGLHGGPAGLLRLMHWLPGFEAPMQHAHSVWEELLFLSGDWLSIERGRAVAGSYFGNPPGWWHSPTGSRDGALVIVHTNQPLDLHQRECAFGQDFVDRYLERGSFLERPEHAGFDAFTRYGISLQSTIEAQGSSLEEVLQAGALSGHRPTAEVHDD